MSLLGFPPGGVERRRYPRVAPPLDLELVVPVVEDVEVLDISSRGVLLSMATHVRVGQRAQVRFLLQREPFTAVVEAIRVDPGTQVGASRRFHVGAVFTSLDESAKRTLGRFLGDGKRAE